MINMDVVLNITPPTYAEFRELYEKDIKENYIPEIEIEKSFEQFKNKTRISWMAEIDGKTVTDAWIFENNAHPGEIAYRILTDVSAILEQNLNKENN